MVGATLSVGGPAISTTVQDTSSTKSMPCTCFAIN